MDRIDNGRALPISIQKDLELPKTIALGSKLWFLCLKNKKIDIPIRMGYNLANYPALSVLIIAISVPVDLQSQLLIKGKINGC
ncbi:MAG: hypothetical protein PHP01_05365 [Phycisphaerae bacterium]|nr:hypothetical protein [Phycisphaerae bacterium]